MADKRVRKEKCTDLNGPCIEVVVGSETPTKFGVHEKLIRASSDFFKKATSGDWKESKERSVWLQDADPDIFQIYVHWLYYQTLPVRIDVSGPDGNIEHLRLAKAYVLGDMLQDIKFKDAAIEAMINKATSKALDGQCSYPLGPVIKVIYDNTLESSKARRLLVDLYTIYGVGRWLSGLATWNDLPKQFLFDLGVALLDKRTLPGTANRYIDPSKYREQQS